MKNIKSNTEIHKDKVEKVLTKGPFYFIRWILIVQIIILTIIFSFGAIFNLIPEYKKFSFRYNAEKLFYKKIDNNDNSTIYLLDTLRKNEYLSEENKEFIIKYLIPEIEENKEYIDLDETGKRLANLRVEYFKKYKIDNKNYEIILLNPKKASLGIAGCYNSVFNKIEMYERIDINDVEREYNLEVYDFAACDKTVYFHELNHVISKGSSSSVMSVYNNKNVVIIDDAIDSYKRISKNVFSELINELFAREYLLNETFKGYDNLMRYMYALTEIIPEEKLREYKFNSNESILISALLEIDNNIENASKFIIEINKIALNEDVDYNKIHDLFKNYYEKKTNKKMIDNMNILAYFYGSEVLTNEEEEAFRNYLNIDKNIDKNIDINVVPKGYFSKEYKKLCPNTLVTFVNNGITQTSKID